MTYILQACVLEQFNFKVCWRTHMCWGFCVMLKFGRNWNSWKPYRTN